MLHYMLHYMQYYFEELEHLTYKKKEDFIKIELDEKIIYEQLKIKIITQDEFIKNRIGFIQSFTKQKKLKVEFEIINSKNNLAEKLLK